MNVAQSAGDRVFPRFNFYNKNYKLIHDRTYSFIPKYFRGDNSRAEGAEEAQEAEGTRGQLPITHYQLPIQYPLTPFSCPGTFYHFFPSAVMNSSLVK